MRPFLPEPDLSERVHDAVLDAICSGELKSGARITQEELDRQRAGHEAGRTVKAAPAS